jgi:protein TonB
MILADVKLTLIQRCLCGSLFLHSAAVGITALAGFTLHRAAWQNDDDPFTLTLIAAPLPAAESAQPNQLAVAPAPIQPAVLDPLEIKPAEPPAPVVIAAEPPLPAAPQSPAIAMAPPRLPVASIARPDSPANAHGDGSAARPGRDAVTITGQPGVQAKPNYLKNPEPLYPAVARRRGQEGLVVMTVKVTAAGRAANVELKESSGFALLDDTALEAVRRWEFEPARVGSRAVEAEIEVPVRFKLSR